MGQYPYHTGARRLKFFEDKNGLIWILYSDYTIQEGIEGYKVQSLDMLNPRTKAIVSVNRNFKESFPFQIQDVFQITSDTNNILWIGTKQGQLYAYDGHFSFTFSLEGRQSIGFAYPASSKSFWLATKEGFMEVDQQGNPLEVFQLEGLTKGFTAGADASLWMSNVDGQNRCQVYLKHPNRSLIEYELPDALNNSRTKIFFDDQDRIWLAARSFFGIWEPEKNKRTDLSKEVYAKITGLKNIFQIYSNQNQQVWLSAHSWQFVINIKENRFSKYLTGQDVSLRGITEFNDSLLWINSYQGVFALNVNSGKTSRMGLEGVSLPTEFLPEEIIYGMGVIQDKSHNIWSGIEGNWILNYNRDLQKIKNLDLPSYPIERATIIPFIDQNKRLWFGLEKGLVFF